MVAKQWLNASIEQDAWGKVVQIDLALHGVGLAALQGSCRLLISPRTAA